VPQSRLFDEMLKLLQTGHSLASIAQLKALGLARGIYPLLDLVVERADQAFVSSALKDTDRRVGEGKPVAPSFLLAWCSGRMCVTAGPSACSSASLATRPCRTPSTTSSTPASATSRGAANWPLTCAKSG
jgi:hypothetical protein